MEKPTSKLSVDMQHEVGIFVTYHPERRSVSENMGRRSMTVLNLGHETTAAYRRIEACGQPRPVTLDLQRLNEYEWPVIVRNVYHRIQLA